MGEFGVHFCKFEWELIGDLCHYFSDEIFRAYCILDSILCQLSFELLLEWGRICSSCLNSYSEDHWESGDNFSATSLKLKDFVTWNLDVKFF